MRSPLSSIGRLSRSWRSGRCCRAYSSAIVEAAPRSSGCAVTSTTRSPPSQISRPSRNDSRNPDAVRRLTAEYCGIAANPSRITRQVRASSACSLGAPADQPLRIVQMSLAPVRSARAPLERLAARASTQVLPPGWGRCSPVTVGLMLVLLLPQRTIQSLCSLHALTRCSSGRADTYQRPIDPFPARQTEESHRKCRANRAVMRLGGHNRPRWLRIVDG